MIPLAAFTPLYRDLSVSTDLGRWGERGGALAPAAPPTPPYEL